eukprot:symbB.v1.2.004720.t1/scaffold273.1/size250767/20
MDIIESVEQLAADVMLRRERQPPKIKALHVEEIQSPRENASETEAASESSNSSASEEAREEEPAVIKRDKQDNDTMSLVDDFVQRFLSPHPEAARLDAGGNEDEMNPPATGSRRDDRGERLVPRPGSAGARPPRPLESKGCDGGSFLQLVKEEASQEAHKSPFVVMPTSVIYNGKEYATLGFADPLSRQHLGCEKNYLPLKEGWSLAQNNSESVAVIAAYGWGTTRLIASNVTYYTANAGPDGVTNFNPQSSPGTPWQAGLLQQNGSQYKVRTCANRILIYKEASYVVKDTSVIYNGKEYATLDFANPSDEDYSGCQETNNWLPLPEGWQLAPGEEDSVKVTAEFGWGTSALILANKSILVTRNGPSIDPDPNGPWAPGSQRSKQGVKTRTRDGQ